MTESPWGRLDDRIRDLETQSAKIEGSVTVSIESLIERVERMEAEIRELSRASRATEISLSRLLGGIVVASTVATLAATIIAKLL